MKKTLCIILVLIMMVSVIPFSVCAKGVAITYVAVGGLGEPKHGDTPGYTITELSSHVKLDTNYDGQSVVWYDLTDGRKLSKTEKFVSGHQYRVKIYVAADDGYYFLLHQGESTVPVTVNGNNAYGTLVDGSENHLEIVYYPEVVGADELTGEVYIPIEAETGTDIYFTRKGKVFNISDKYLKVQWQIKGSTDKYFSNIDGATDQIYHVTASDLGKEIRVRLGADGDYNYIYSAPKKVIKQENYGNPVPATLSVDGDQLYLWNCVEGQEYILASTQKDEISDAEWRFMSRKYVNHYQGINITDAATLNSYIYVYTRFSETDIREAGTKVACTKYYFSEHYYLKDIQLICVTPENEIIAGGVAELRVMPLPENATGFDGIRGSDWLIDSSSSKSEYAAFFANKECTIPLNESSYYKTVFLSLKKPKTGLEIAVQKTIGYNDLLRDTVRLNVLRTDHYYYVSYINCDDVVMYKGDIIESYLIDPYPFPADLKDITLSCSKAGAPYAVINNTALYNSIRINASSAEPGEYYFSFSNGSYGIGSFKVTVLDLNDALEMPGDVNGDGYVDNKDVVVLFRYISGANVSIFADVADINNDGSLDNKDVVLLFRLVSEDGPKG